MKIPYSFLFAVIIYLSACRMQTYLLNKDSAAKQMTDLKIVSKNGIDFDFSNGKNYGNTNYTNDLNYLIIKNQKLNFDTILPFDIKFYLKSGINSGYIDPSKIIFKDGYFISFHDSVIKTHSKWKFGRINIDSVEKIIVRGYRLNKVK